MTDSWKCKHVGEGHLALFIYTSEKLVFDIWKEVIFLFVFKMHRSASNKLAYVVKHENLALWISLSVREHVSWHSWDLVKYDLPSSFPKTFASMFKQRISNSKVDVVLYQVRPHKKTVMIVHKVLIISGVTVS